MYKETNFRGLKRERANCRRDGLSELRGDGKEKHSSRESKERKKGKVAFDRKIEFDVDPWGENIRRRQEG